MHTFKRIDLRFEDLDLVAKLVDKLESLEVLFFDVDKHFHEFVVCSDLGGSLDFGVIKFQFSGIRFGSR